MAAVTERRLEALARDAERVRVQIAQAHGEREQRKRKEVAQRLAEQEQRLAEALASTAAFDRPLAHVELAIAEVETRLRLANEAVAVSEVIKAGNLLSAAERLAAVGSAAASDVAFVRAQLAAALWAELRAGVEASEAAQRIAFPAKRRFTTAQLVRALVAVGQEAEAESWATQLALQCLLRPLLAQPLSGMRASEAAVELVAEGAASAAGGEEAEAWRAPALAPQDVRGFFGTLTQLLRVLEARLPLACWQRESRPWQRHWAADAVASVLRSKMPRRVRALGEYREALQWAAREAWPFALQACEEARAATQQLAERLETEFAALTRVRALEEARELLLLGFAPELRRAASGGAAASDAPGKVESAQLRRSAPNSLAVSPATHHLAQLVVEVLAEANTPECPPAVRDAHVEVARDVVHLFCAVTPALLGERVRTIPQTSAQLFADCVYWASYLERLPEVAYLARPVRRLGQGALAAQLEAQREELTTLLARHDEQALKQALHTIGGRVARGVAGLATAQSRAHLVRAALNLVLQDLTDWVLVHRDIGQDAAAQMHQLMLAVDTHAPLAAAGEGEAQAQALLRGCVGWPRFEAVRRVLEPAQNLASLQREWDEGRLAGLRPAELVRLLHALFDDSEKRRALVKRVEAAGAR